MGGRSGSGMISAQDCMRVYKLIAECEELGHRPAQWRLHLANGVEELLGGVGAHFILSSENGTARDGSWSFSSGGQEHARVFRSFWADGGFTLGPEYPIVFPAILQQRRYAWRSSVLIPWKEMQASALHERYLTQLRVRDRCSASVVRGSLMTSVCICRSAGERKFGLREQDLVFLVAHLVSERLQHSLHTEESLGMLSRRQIDVLDLLLTGRSEKEIAERVGLSRHTIHDHIKDIYSRIGVHSRPELMAVFARARRRK